MRVEIAACLLTVSLAMLVPETILPPVANPLKRGLSSRSVVVRNMDVQASSPIVREPLRESLMQGGEAERVEFNKRNESDRAAQHEERATSPEVDFARLQNTW